MYFQFVDDVVFSYNGRIVYFNTGRVYNCLVWKRTIVKRKTTALFSCNYCVTNSCTSRIYSINNEGKSIGPVENLLQSFPKDSVLVDKQEWCEWMNVSSGRPTGSSG